MAKKFKNLLDAMPKESRYRIERRKAELIQTMRIQELRKLSAVTQREMAECLAVRQPSISKLEHQDDMLLSTLRDYLSGLGANLKIVAQFKDIELPIEFLNNTQIRGDKPAGGHK